ncbi:MAG: lipid kinase [Burkholderia sp.]|nr:lipid kinase [Burkholderia sp.]
MTEALRRRALMLINPNARRGSDNLTPVIARLEHGGIDVTVERFETPGEVSPDIKRRRDEADLVIVCGGDPR